MTAAAVLRKPTARRAFQGRGDVVYPAYWVAACGLAGAMLLQVPLEAPAAVAAGTLLFLGGGLPHGAYDIALLRRAVALRRGGMALAVGCYAAVALAMAALWMTVPLAALILFLLAAAVHFGEDWQMLEEPLLRFAAGAAILAAPAIGHPAEVSALFGAMSDPRSDSITRIIIAAAPVVLMVTAVGIAIAWRDGSRHWAAAMALCLVLLIVAPPVAGFALFFVFLHSPRHLAQTRGILRDMTQAQWLATGASLSAAAVFGWWGVQRLAAAPVSPVLAAQAFQLLAAVAVPHLLLSRWLEKRLADAPRPARPR
ncbi:beta-carotene 15,15'-dioxygenase, Brp/Blh family [Sphingomonas sp. CJ20]